MQQATTAQTPVPRNRAELEALNIKRIELQSQLKAITQRREELNEQLRTSSSDRMAASLRERIQGFDDRAARLERDIMQADDAMAAAVTAGVANPRTQATPAQQTQATTAQPTQPPQPAQRQRGRDFPWEIFAIVGVVIVMWRWATTWGRRRSTPLAADQSAKLEQLQRAVDVIAVEVERVAENQRFVSKLLNDKVLQQAESIPRKATADSSLRSE